MNGFKLRELESFARFWIGLFIISSPMSVE